MASAKILSRYIFTAIGVAAAGGIGVNLAHHSTQKSVSQQSFVQEAVSKFSNNERALLFLGGGPVTVKPLNLQELHQQKESLELKTSITVKGNTKKGDLLILSNRVNVEDDFTLQSVMLQFKKQGKLETVWIYPEEKAAKQAIKNDNQNEKKCNVEKQESKEKKPAATS